MSDLSAQQRQAKAGFSPAAFDRLRRLVVIETIVIAVLVGIFVLIVPFAQPAYEYVARKPEGQSRLMTGLDMPNMTNRAILSWATTSITEIMTMGFGDMDVHLPKQKWRFNEQGWAAYTKAMTELDVGQTFKHSQLVLTTVPSNTPVIIGQGTNVDNVYQWNVQMPVIMTYSTNNNVEHKERAMISLSIVRVPTDNQNAVGIGIQSWNLSH